MSEQNTFEEKVPQSDEIEDFQPLLKAEELKHSTKVYEIRGNI